MATKYSKQRTLILEELQCRCDHPTADELYISLRKKMPNLSLATVYRNLGLLEQNGFIRRIPSNGPDHFDADTTSHHHLICMTCSSVLDVFLPQGDELCIKAQEVTDAHIHSYSLIFNGVCQTCQQKEKLNSKTI